MEKGSKCGALRDVLIPLSVTGAAISINIGAFFWGSAPKWYHVLVSAAYLLFWIGYRLLCARKTDRAVFLIFGVGTLFTGLLALPAAVWDLGIVSDMCTLPAILLSVVFVAPVYGGAGLLRGHALRWVLVLALGAVWTAAGLLPVRKSD